MYNYFYDTVVSLDIALFLLTIVTASVTMLYLIHRERDKERYNRRLVEIKRNLRAFAASGKTPSSGTCPVVAVRGADEFIDVETNRESVLFTGEEREYVKSCLVGSGLVARLERTASRSRDKWRRIEAILALGYLGSEDAIPLLEKTMHERDDDIAYFSVLALGHIRTAASASALMRAIHRKVASGYKIASILESFPPETADVLMPLAEKGDTQVRFWAVKVISRLKRPDLAERVAKLARDRSADMRAAACECIGAMRSPSALPALRDCLRDGVWYVRLHATRSLEKLMGPEAVPLVAPLIRTDSHWQVKRAVGECLARHIDRAMPELVEMLRAADRAAQEECVEIIEASGYLKKILDGILGAPHAPSGEDLEVLELVIRAGAHRGFESVIGRYASADREKALSVIASIDPSRAEHIGQKIRGEIVEL